MKKQLLRQQKKHRKQFPHRKKITSKVCPVFISVKNHDQKAVVF
jgi:hypothetical protein